jgi:hypothetical protein
LPLFRKTIWQSDLSEKKTSALSNGGFELGSSLGTKVAIMEVLFSFSFRKIINDDAD